MKSKLIVGVIISLFCLQFETQAGGNGKFRNEKCKGLFQKWNYKAQAHACKLGICNLQEKWSCDQDIVAEKSKSCAYSRIANGPSGFSRAGSWSKKTCNHGYPFSDLYNYISAETEESSNNSEGQIENFTGKVVFTENNQVEIQNLNGYTLVSDNGYYGDFKFIIWKRDDTNDEIFNEGKILYEGSVGIREGVVTCTGEIQASDYEVITNSEGTRIQFNNLTKSFQLPLGSDELIEVDLSFNGGDNEFYEINGAVNNTPSQLVQDNIQFDIIGNPINAASQVIFQSSIESNFDLKVYDMNGNFVYTIASGNSLPGQVSTWNFNDNIIATGLNYVVLKVDNKFYVKTIMK